MAARLIPMALVMALAMPVAAASLPDPTALPKSLSAPAAETGPAETGLAWVKLDGAHPVAWYGGTTVGLGDEVDGGRVTAIREDHIVISGAGGRRTVYLLDHSIRTTPRAQAARAR